MNANVARTHRSLLNELGAIRKIIALIYTKVMF